MAKEANRGWQHHWVAAASLYKRRNRLYSQLSAARAAATAEHLLAGHLVGLGHCWHVLEANPAKPAEVFALLTACLCSNNPQAHTKAHDQMAALFDSLSSQDDPELWRAIETALTLAAPLGSSGANGSAINELIEQFPAARSRMIESGFLPSDDEEAAAIRLLVEDHQTQPFFKGDRFNDDGFKGNESVSEGSRHCFMALGLAARLDDSTALGKLVSLEDQYPDRVLPAYWLASTQPALERLLSALSTPHLASEASQVWQVMTGQTLNQQPAVGMAGQKKKSGPLMPELEPALQWWEQHRGKTGPWLDGKPADLSSLQAYITQYCGLATLPVWWLLQFEQKKAMPDLVMNWHRYRVTQLKKGLLHGA